MEKNCSRGCILVTLHLVSSTQIRIEDHPHFRFILRKEIPRTSPSRKDHRPSELLYKFIASTQDDTGFRLLFSSLIRTQEKRTAPRRPRPDTPAPPHSRLVGPTPSTALQTCLPHQVCDPARADAPTMHPFTSPAHPPLLPSPYRVAYVPPSPSQPRSTEEDRGSRNQRRIVWHDSSNEMSSAR